MQFVDSQCHSGNESPTTPNAQPLGDFRGRLDVGKKRKKSVLGAPGGKDEQVNQGTSLPESHHQGKEIHEIAQNKQLCLALAGENANCCFGARGLTQSKFQRNQQGLYLWAVGFITCEEAWDVKNTETCPPEMLLAVRPRRKWLGRCSNEEKIA